MKKKYRDEDRIDRFVGVSLLRSEYATLAAEAERLGRSVSNTARMYIRAQLCGSPSWKSEIVQK